MTASDTPMAGPDVGHTPGPWFVSIGDPECVTFGSRADILALSYGEFIDCNTPANARLIAAAPEMLEALKGMLRVCPSERHGMKLAEYEAARAAIAKATANPIDILPLGEGHE